MDNDHISRPQSDSSKISYKEQFESCYLRHRYLQKTTHNPSLNEMAPYMAIVKKFAKKTFQTYKTLFYIIGFDVEDIISIGQVHLVNFLGLFALETSDEKLENFQDSFYRRTSREPSKRDLLDKNKANFTIFIKQRMEDVVRICRQKGKNIKGVLVEKSKLFVGPNKPPRNLDDLLINNESFGFRKLSAAIFRKARKEANTTEEIFQFNDLWYVSVPLEKRKLALSDFSGSDLDPYDNIHNMSPEYICSERELETSWKEKEDAFNDSSKEKKVLKLKKFVNSNKHNPELSEEISTARRILKSLRNLRE